MKYQVIDKRILVMLTMMLALVMNAKAQQKPAEGQQKRMMEFQVMMAMHDTTYKNYIKDGKYKEAITPLTTLINILDTTTICQRTEFSKQTADTSAFAHTRVFAPKFGYLEDPATGSGNSAFANYLLSEGLWKGEPIMIEQGGNNRVFNSLKLKCQDGKVLFGGKATKKIEGEYYI